MTKYLLFLFFSFFFCYSCTDPKKEDKLLATCYGNELYFSEVKDIIPEQSDSIEFIKSYVENWIKTQLMLSQAELNLSEELQDVNRKIETYRTSLLIYAYQQDLIKYNFDTTVTQSEITSYFEKNKREFQLKENIFRVRFVQIPKNAPNQNTLIKLIKSKKEEDKEALLDYCYRFATHYHLDEKIWITFSEFTDRLPEQYRNTNFFKGNGLQTISTDSNYVLLQVQEYQLYGNDSPLDFVKEEIRQIILNKNKTNFLKEVEEELYQKALKKEEIKNYL